MKIKIQNKTQNTLNDRQTTALPEVTGNYYRYLVQQSVLRDTAATCTYPEHRIIKKTLRECKYKTVSLHINASMIFFFLFRSSPLLSSSTRGRFYPQRSSGQAVVTGVVPPPPVRAFSFYRA